MIANADVTIYNHYQSESVDKWQRTTITGVNWYGSRDITLTNAGQVSADRYKVRIPHDAGVEDGRSYLPPKAWEAMADKSLHWTIQENDKLVQGAVSHDIMRLSSELEGLYDTVATVIGWSDNRRGVVSSQHWRIEGK